jgi:hypothetical protein
MTTPTTPITASVGERPSPQYTCVWCNAELNDYSSNPKHSDIAFPHPDRTGIVRHHCLPCVSARVFPGTRDASPTEPRWVNGELEMRCPDCNGLKAVVNHHRCGDTKQYFDAPHPSPTAPRAEGGEEWIDTAAEHIVLFLTHNIRHNRVNDEKAVIDWVKSCIRRNQQPSPTPPRDRCEVCGGTRTVLGLTSDLAVRHVPCPRCTKETPCDSSGSSAASSATSTSSKPVTTSPAGDADTSKPSGSSSASDPATVAGEGPYRVVKGGGWGDGELFAVYEGKEFVMTFGDEHHAKTHVNLANHAHRTALAVREGEVVALRAALNAVVVCETFKSSDRLSIAVAIARDALKGDAR